MKNNNRIVFSDNKQEYTRKIDCLMDKFGYISRSEAIRRAIDEFYFKYFKEKPDYVRIQEERLKVREAELALSANMVSNPEVITKNGLIAKEAREELRRERELEKKKKICSELNGELIRTPGGYACIYTNYNLLNPYEVQQSQVKEPLETLSSANLEYQYQGGTREEIEEVMNSKTEDHVQE